MICLPYEFKTLRVFSLRPSSKLFPRWVSNLCIQNLLHMFCAQAHRTGLSVWWGDSSTLPHLLWASSLMGLSTLLLNPNKMQKKIPTQTSSFLALWSWCIILLVTGFKKKKKQLQPSFSCYFWLCWTCSTPLWQGRKLSCHRTTSLHVREDEKTA